MVVHAFSMKVESECLGRAGKDKEQGVVSHAGRDQGPGFDCMCASAYLLFAYARHETPGSSTSVVRIVVLSSGLP